MTMRDERSAPDASQGQPRVIIKLDGSHGIDPAGTAREARIDPVPAVHQLLGLRSYEELKAADRSALESARDRLVMASRAGSSHAWLGWYRECFALIGQLTARWQSQDDVGAVLATPGAPTPLALAQVKESPVVFLQRWQVRLVDQATTVTQRLVTESKAVDVVIDKSDAQLKFRIPQADQNRFGEYVGTVLNDWSRKVETELVSSWYEHLREVVHAERLKSGPTMPPQWSHVSLTSSTPLIPTGVGSMSVRHASKNLAALGGAGSSSAFSLVVSVATLALTLRNLDREIASVIDEQSRALQEKLSSWAVTRVEVHRNRIGTLITAGLGATQARLAQWADAAWPLPAAPRPRHGQPDLGPLTATANLARSAIATRIAELEHETLRGAGYPR